MSHRLEAVGEYRERESEVKVLVRVVVEKEVSSVLVEEEALFPLRGSVTLVQDCRLWIGIPHIFVRSLSISDILALSHRT